ncbi:hypothetical protein M3Y99_00157600 [Aphelenchoides fujianensis]|nr:hypothetical protein M3Y99_00157600 [Aphelenchoides fujianensis]
MAASCKHRAFLSSVHSVQNRGADVRSSKNILLCRPGTKFRLVLTKQADTRALHVKIAIEGPAEGLKAEMWVLNAEGGEHIRPTLLNLQHNTGYWVSALLNHRVFCKVWTEECPLCKQAKQNADHEKALQSFRSQLKQSKTRLSEQRLQSENSRKALESRIKQLEQAAVDNERKLAAVVDENESLKKETEESAAKISELTAALAEEKEARELVVATNVAAATLENELLRLDSRIDSLKKRLAKQRESAENTQKQLRFRIRAMEEKAVAKKRNYGSILSALQSKCGRLQEEAKIAAESQAELTDRCSSFEKEVEELKSALADEQTRFSALQQEHRAEIEAERKERADELAAVNGKKADETLKEENECMRSQVFNFKHEEEAERENAVDSQAKAVSPSAVPADWEPVDAK